MANSQTFFNPFHPHQQEQVIDFLVIMKKKPIDWDLLVQVLQIKGWEHIECIEIDPSLPSVSTQIKNLSRSYQKVLCLIQTIQIDQSDSLTLFNMSQFLMKQDQVQQISAIDLAQLWDRQLSAYLNLNPSVDQRHVYFFEQITCCLDDLEKAVIHDQIADHDINPTNQSYYEYLEKFCNLFAFIQEYNQAFLKNQDFNTSQLIYRSSFSMIMQRFEPLWAFLSHKINEWQLVEYYLKQLVEHTHMQTAEDIAKHYHQSIHYLLLQRHVVRAKALIDQMCDQVEIEFDHHKQQHAIGDLVLLMQQHISAMEDMKEFKGANELYVYGLHQIFKYLERDFDDLYLLADLIDDDDAHKCNLQKSLRPEIEKDEMETMRNFKLRRVFHQIKQYYAYPQGHLN
jgi:hypothetical protein